MLEHNAVAAGYGLAQDVVSSSTAVSVQVFQSTLLAAFNEALYGKAISFTPEVQQTLLKVALELGQTYAKLAPSPDTSAIPTSDRDFGFLDILWRAQQPGTTGMLPDRDTIAAQLDQGVKALGRLLNGVSDPVATLKFLNNLLSAAANSVSLNEVRVASNGRGFDPRGDVRSPQFIYELIKFGFEVAKVNPTVTTTGEAVVSEFLNTLWRGGDERKGQAGLNQFFEGVKGTSDRIKLLGFGDRLMDAAQLMSGQDLQSQKKDARFLSQLLNLGSSYAALNPMVNQEKGFFLNTLWRDWYQSEVVTGVTLNTRTAASELEIFLNGFSAEQSRLEMLRLGRKMLSAFDKISDSRLQRDFRNAQFLGGMLELANDHIWLSRNAWSEISETESDLTNSFLTNIRGAESKQEIEIAATKFQNLLLQGNLIDDSEILGEYYYLPIDRSSIIAQLQSLANLRQQLGSDPAAHTGLSPYTARQNPYHEAQRVWALEIVWSNAKYICEVATTYNITPDAIAGAILWEALENPYNAGLWGRGIGLLSVTRPGTEDDFGIPGKIHIDDEDIAAKVEYLVKARRPDAFVQRGLGRPASSRIQRERRLLSDPTIAIEYIGAVLYAAAWNYEQVSDSARQINPKVPRNFSIRDQAGVLDILYQGGIDTDGRLQRLYNNLINDQNGDLKDDATGKYIIQFPPPEKEKMGSWVSEYRWWIRDLLAQSGCPPRGFERDGRFHKPAKIPYPHPYYPNP